MLWAVAAPAQAAGAPDGYSCSEEAFTNIGGLHGVGVGEVRQDADLKYRATKASFTYAVRDRGPFGGMGYGRMSATWDLAGGRANALAPIRSVWLPFHRGLPSRPASVAISLDEGPPVSFAIDDSWLQKDSDGRANGLRLPAAAAPELRGRRSFGYQVKAEDGTDLFSDFLLMPEWKKVPGRIGLALGRARSMLRKKKCDPFYIIGRSGG
jgi:hypothetical protein